ncbi:MAG: hypothetical protein QXU32_02375 [Nitrososphaerales archaeon]
MPKTSSGRCAIKDKEAKRRYDMSEKGKMRYKRYDASEKGKARHQRYDISEKGRIRRKRYNNSEKGRIRYRKYWYGNGMQRAAYYQEQSDMLLLNQIIAQWPDIWHLYQSLDPRSYVLSRRLSDART